MTADLSPPSDRIQLWPAFTLLLLSPLIGEFLLGNMSIDMLWLLPLLALLYGGGALLVRETALRMGAGWPGILLLALAYGIVEEALVTQSLFDRDFMGQRLLDYGYLAALGMGAWWTVFVLTLHGIWSVAAAIALSEALWPRHAAQPWLPGPSFPFVGLLFVIGCVGVAYLARASTAGSPVQLAGSVLAIALLVAATWQARKRRRANPSAVGKPGARWVVWLASFLLLSFFMITTWTIESVSAATNVGMMIGLLGLLGLLVARWSRRAGWGLAHRLAVSGGALLTYAWWGLLVPPHVTRSTPQVDLIGNLLFVAGTLALLFVASRRVARA